MVLGRILAGIGIGISSAVVPLYISEVNELLESSSVLGNCLLVDGLTVTTLNDHICDHIIPMGPSAISDDPVIKHYMCW